MDFSKENHFGRRVAPATKFFFSATALALVMLALVAPSEARLATPVPASPLNGAVLDAVPPFGWTSVRGAVAYEFQIAADAGMNSPVLGRRKDQFQTKNLRATLSETIPNGKYHWRVRAITARGGTSPWSRPRSFEKRWSGAATLLTPAPEQSVKYPSDPLRLSWTVVSRAASYRVAIATDRGLGSLVGGKAIETVATSFTRTSALPPGVYYWAVTPLDARGNPGIPSAVSSFRWEWPSKTVTRVTDLAAEPEVFDPEFSWDPVPGAARYQVDVNSSQDFAAGSRVCCSSLTTATSLSPTTLLKDNVYYWRVRAIDIDDNAGEWNAGPSFNKTFDKVLPVGPVVGPSIRNLHLADNLGDPGQDRSVEFGYQTRVPMLRWDPVPGASSYQVEVTPWSSALGACNWAAGDATRWQTITATTAWTPLATSVGGNPPFGNPSSVSADSTRLIENGQYCARVRAQSDRDTAGKQIFGDYTDLPNNERGWAFQWVGYPTADERSAGCNGGTYLCADDYGSDPTSVQRGQTVTRMPVFTWKPIAGKASYWVIVAKDETFTNIVDYALTELPAYAPRKRSQPATYPDETTAYYWVVLPAIGSNGAPSAAGSPVLASAAPFHKRSNAPSERAPLRADDPSGVSDVYGQPTFRWAPAEGARRYRLQVARDPSFANAIDDVTTNSTAYTSDTTYPADTVLYWRVRAEDENHVGLSWSCERDQAAGCTAANTKTFRKLLRAPELGEEDKNQSGDDIPTWTWKPTPGAVSYDIAADLPDGRRRDVTGIRTAALTPTLMYGTGVFQWRVRANFPTLTSKVVPGPYSEMARFTRTIGEPGGARAERTKKSILLAWEPKAGAKGYRVEISERRDFGRSIETLTTDNTSFAPQLTHSSYERAGSLYWRVAAYDEGNNVGDFTPGQQIGRPKRMALSARGTPSRRRTVAVTITVLDGAKRPLRLVRVRAKGAGMRPAVRRTNARGNVTFTVRATRRGTITYRATKTGYEPAVLTQRVR